MTDLLKPIPLGEELREAVVWAADAARLEPSRLRGGAGRRLSSAYEAALSKRYSSHLTALIGLGRALGFYSMPPTMKLAPVDAPDAPPSASVHAALLEWAFGDDTGMSSKALARTAAGIPPRTREGNSYPSDTHDFGRCVRLIEAVPEARAAVDLLATVGPVWAGLAARWDEFTEKHRAGTLTYEEYKAAQQ